MIDVLVTAFVAFLLVLVLLVLLLPPASLILGILAITTALSNRQETRTPLVVRQTGASFGIAAAFVVVSLLLGSTPAVAITIGAVAAAPAAIAVAVEAGRRATSRQPGRGSPR